MGPAALASGGAALIRSNCTSGATMLAKKQICCTKTPTGLQAVEIKSGATFASDWLHRADKWLSSANNT